jgi:Tfp pilus assembly protein PilN
MKLNIPIKVNEREKKFLIIGGTAVLFILAFLLFTWYGDTKDRLKDFSDDKYYILQKQLDRMAESKNIDNKAKKVEAELNRLENTLLKGNTPPVAAAALQKFLKDTAAISNIDVKLERTLNPVVLENYLGIPVEIGFSTSTKSLQDLMVRLRKSAFLLTVSEIKIRVTNISKPEEIYTTLVVTGFIRNTKENDMNNKEAKNAA